MAYVISPEGVPGSVPNEQLQEALQAGYKQRQPSEQELARETAAEQPLAAFGEGVVRGATLGFGEPALKVYEGGLLEGETLEGAGEKILARKEANPLAAGAGELGGVVGTSLLTGGGASALAGGGLKGAAFEGGLMGVGSMISENALENKELTTEQLAAGITGGALSAGGAHLALSTLGKGISLTVSKFGGVGLKGSLESAASSAEWRALSEGNAAWAKKNAPFKEEILEFGRKHDILGTAGAALDKKTADKAAAVADSFRTKISDQMDDLERLAPLKGNAKDRMRLVNAIEAKLDDEFGMNPVYDSAVASAKKLTERIASEPAHTWKSVWDVQSSLFKEMAPGTVPPAAAEVKEALRQGFRDFVFDDVAAQAGLPAGLSASMRKTGAEARAAMALSKGLLNRATSLESSGGVVSAMGRLGAGAMLGFYTGNPAFVVGGAVVEQQLRKRGGLLAGAALRGLSESKISAGISKQLSGRLGTILKTAPEVLEAYRYPLAIAAAKGADALMTEHARLAAGPEGQHYLSTVGLPAETSEEVGAAGQRLAILDSLERQAAEQDATATSAVDGLFGSARGRKPSVGGAMSIKEFKEVSASIKDALANPEALFGAVQEGVQAGAPGLSSGAVAQVLKAYQFLSTKLPKNPYEGMPPALSQQWQPSAAELDRFNRYKDAVTDHAKILKNMANGYVSPEQAEALRMVYPAIYEDLRQKISARLMQSKGPIPYSKKLAISALLGTEALSMSQQQMQILQTLQGAGSQQEQGGMKGPDGRQEVNQEKSLMTQAQKLEAR